MPLYTDLRELKPILEVEPDDPTEDKNLTFFVEYASDIVEEFCDRDFVYKTRTRVMPGTGTKKLILKYRPVYVAPANPAYPPISVVYDQAGYYGQAAGAFTQSSPTMEQMNLGVDYAIRIDRDDGGSREAILYHIKNVWQKPITRSPGLLSPYVGIDLGSYQITYTAGYTVDTLPAAFRLAVNEIVARLRFIFPIAGEITGGDYDQFSVNIQPAERNYLLGLAKQHLWMHKNFKF